MALNARQQRFIEEYKATANATQSAKNAGYSEKTAYSIGQRLLKNVEIASELEKWAKDVKAALVADQDEVLQTLTRVLRREEREHTVVVIKQRRSYYDEKGKKVIEEDEVPQVVEIPPRLCDVNKAAELLGKRYGLYTEKIDMNGDVTMVFEDDYGDEDDEDG